jgi:succinate dehydrogenase/fumarate reductase-like Fe-S protein
MSACDELVAHSSDCQGHHCIVCGCCLDYDPTSKWMRQMLDEPKALASTCSDCADPEPPLLVAHRRKRA